MGETLRHETRCEKEGGKKSEEQKKKKKRARVLVQRDSSQRYSFISGDGVIRGGLISGRS